MKTFVCQVCGHIEFNTPPEKCPICGAPKEKFKEDPDAIKKPGDPSNKVETEQKHIPSIKIARKCDLLGGGCTDVLARIGEVIHPMEEKHFIQHIDFYLDYKFISRQKLSPVVMNPASCVHLKASAGKITVLQNCNLHGNWMKEAEL